MLRFLAALFPAVMLVAQTNAPVCAVEGSVVNAATGEPIVRAHVMLMGPGGQKAVTTDTTGHWSFPSVGCGQTQVIATRPGFLQGAFGQPRPGAAFRPVILVSGEPLHDVKIQLTPQAVVSGKVVDDHGDPLANAMVQALAPRIVAGLRTFQNVNTQSTNDLGEYRLANLPPGKYIICATPQVVPFAFEPGDVSTVLGPACYPGPPDSSSAGTIEARGSENRADFTLSQVPSVKIRGSITNAVRGVGISLTKRFAMNGGRSQPGMVRPDGTFEVPSVIPGSYLLATDFFEGGRRLTARVPIEVGASDVEGVTVRLEPGFSLAGSVRVESAQGQTAAPQNIRISLRAVDPQLAGGGQFAWNSTHDAFTISELTPGNYWLEAFTNGSWYVKSATLGGRDLLKEPAVLSAGAGRIEMTVRDDAGQIEDADGQPAAGWVMVLQDGRTPRNIMSMPDGHFSIPGIAPGEYKVYSWDDWQQVEYANPDWMRRFASGTSVTIDPAQTAHIKLRRQNVPDTP